LTSSGSSSSGSSTTPSMSSTLTAVSEQRQQQEGTQHRCLKAAQSGPALRLSAVPRSFHCRARQDCPCAPPGGEGGG
jgi:hypothetical protein